MDGERIRLREGELVQLMAETGVNGGYVEVGFGPSGCWLKEPFDMKQLVSLAKMRGIPVNQEPTP
jgi:hypothetical protein